MRKISIILFAMFLAVSICGIVNAMPYNVAEGASVSLNGGAFFTGGWGAGLTVESGTAADGIFFPRSTQWDQGAVWWDSADGAERYLTVDLGGIFSIESFVVQADDNDAYILSYRDMTSNEWVTAWDIPNFDFIGNENAWGMQTRPDPFDDLARYVLAENIITDALRFEGALNNTADSLFSVSEIQAYGEPVPEPATIALLGLGIAGLAGYRKKFRKQA